MFKYAIVEIAGKQYTIKPDHEFIVNSLGESQKHVCDKVLLLVDDSGVTLGTPYLKDTLEFEVLSTGKGKKVRVAKFHAKANFRRVRGFRPMQSKVKLATDTAVKTTKKAPAKTVTPPTVETPA